VGWATLLIGVGTFGLLLVAVFVALLWSSIRNARLGPPRIRGLSREEEPRYLELATEPARRRLEALGFQRAGVMATQPIGRADPEVAQVVMRNDEARTLAYLHVRFPFTETRPSSVSFESFLPDGTAFSTRDRLISSVVPALPNRQRSNAPDEPGVYRDHLAGLGRSGLMAIELPPTFEGLVALNVNDAASTWRTRLEHGSVVPQGQGEFRYSRWTSLACIPRLLFGQLRGALLESQRRQSDHAQGPFVDGSAPEIRHFLDERARRRKEAAAAATASFKTGSTRKAMLWMAMVIGFTFMWRYLNHRPR
jgi:hypothetical protein